MNRKSLTDYIIYLWSLIVCGFVLFLTSSLWRGKSIEVSFHAVADKDIAYQVFWTEKQNQKFDRKRSTPKKRVNSGETQVKISIPTKKIKDFRLDIGERPGKVVLSDFQIAGFRLHSSNYQDFQYNRDIAKHAVEDKKLILESDKGDPFILYRNLSARTPVFWEYLVILAMVSFFLCSKLTLLLLNLRSRQYAWSDIALVILFFGLISIPMLHINDETISKQEKTGLPRKPQLIVREKLNHDYGKQFDNWFTKRFLGRYPLIYAYTLLRYATHPASLHTKALIGSDGWMYIKKFNSIPMYQNTNLFTRAELEICGRNIKNFVDTARRRGVKQVYFVLHNDKESMYPEYYPSCIRKIGKTSQLEQLLQYVHQKYPDIHFLNFLDKFEKIKPKEIVYHKTGTHMNPVGSFYEYIFLMDEIRKDFPGLYALNWKDMTIREKHPSFQETERLNNDILFQEIVLPGFSAENLSYRDVSIPPLPHIRETSFKVHTIMMGKTKYFSPDSKQDLKLFILSDSFAQRYIQYFPYTFRTVYHGFYAVLNFDMGGYERKELKTNMPDIVVVATTERFLYRFLNLKFPEN